MKNDFSKNVLIQAIKYAPTVLAITCSVKILLLSMNDSDKSIWEYGVNWVNWCLNISGLAVFCCMGRYLGYCWKHRSLCRLAMWGYIYYAVFLVVGTPREEVRPLAMLYMAVVLIISIIYKEMK